MKEPLTQGGNDKMWANDSLPKERLRDQRGDEARDEVLLSFEELLEETEAVESTDPAMLAFDDEPIDAVLYDVASPGPSPADYYGLSDRTLKSILSAVEQGATPAAIRLAAAMGEEEVPLSARSCQELLKLLAPLFPLPPGQMVEHDLSGLGGLLRRIWDLATERADEKLKKEAGILLERWYERHERYGEARRIIVKLVSLWRKEGDSEDAAGLINNYGFTFWLEGNLRKAAPIFRRAAELFARTGQMARQANARANYWMCRIDSNGLDDLEALEEELERLALHLRGSSYWQERKVCLLRAKLAERIGELDAAIRHLEKAIQLTRGKRSVYTQMDTDYLRRLRLLRSGESHGDQTCRASI